MKIEITKVSADHFKGVDGERLNRETLEWAQEQEIKRNTEHPINGDFSNMLRLLNKQYLDDIETYCESEIEKQLAYALLFLAKREGIFTVFISPKVHNRLLELPTEKDEGWKGILTYFAKADLVITPNMPFKMKNGKTVRVDFLLSYQKETRGKRKLVSIECDSFQYHSSQQQLMAEKKRERVMLEMPWQIIRFAGGELHKNPLQMAHEVLQYCFD